MLFCAFTTSALRSLSPRSAPTFTSASAARLRLAMRWGFSSGRPWDDCETEVRLFAFAGSRLLTALHQPSAAATGLASLVHHGLFHSAHSQRNRAGTRPPSMTTRGRLPWCTLSRNWETAKGRRTIERGLPVVDDGDGSDCMVVVYVLRILCSYHS